MDGTMLPMTITLERNSGSDKLKIPYIAHVECQDIVNRGPDFDVPIRVANVGMKKTFIIEVAGFRQMTERLNQVPELLERLIDGLMYANRLPHYVFIARDAGVVYPVYTVDNEVIAPTPNGPQFQHVELAKVRDRLTAYLHETSILGKQGRKDKFHVRGIHRLSLQLVRPTFYLKKRISGEDDFWAPVFCSTDSPKIYVYIANQRREARLDDGREVLTLRKLVATMLVADGRLSDPLDLRPDRMFEERWLELAQSLQPAADELQITGIPLPLYIADDGTYIALETRRDEERFSLYLGSDAADVERRAQHDFLRRGIGL